ncbi:MAG: hypothetical protein PHX03_05285 [Bacilli bacterium]|nr:hypothetical protein [Bacilli bacterium]
MKNGFLACYPEYEHKNIKYIKFSDANTILECDMIILELEWLFDEYETSGNYNGIPELTTYNSTQIVNDVKKRKSELLEFLNSGKTVVVLNGNDEYRYRYTGRKEYSGTGRNTRITNIVTEIHPSEILPVKIQTFKLEGNNVILKNKKASNFYQKYKDNYKYLTVYENIDKNKILFNIQNTEKVISFYEKVQNGTLLFLPSLNLDNLTKEKGQKLEKQYFDDIYDLVKALNSEDEVLLPEYSKKYLLPKEDIMLKDITSEKLRLDELQKSIDNKEQILKEMQKEKIIFTGSGTLLEKTIVKELECIGFQILKYDENGKDEDIVVSCNDKIAVIEVKGVDGSATEKHTSQTVKWKSMYHIDNAILPKGFLIVNAFKSTELDNRQDAFPTQMLKYAKQQEICLLTAIQIFNIKCYLEQNPEKKEEILNELYKTNGTYNKFIDWNLNIKNKLI